MSEKQELLEYERKILNILKEKIENIQIGEWKYKQRYKGSSPKLNPSDFKEYIYLDGNGNKIRVCTDEKEVVDGFNGPKFELNNYVEFYKNGKLLYRFEEEDKHKSSYKILERKKELLIAKLIEEEKRKEIAKKNTNKKREDRRKIIELSKLESLLGQTTL